MLLKLKYTAFALLFFISLKAQENLVLNPSFEDLNNCAITNDNFDETIQNWFAAIKSPDIYNYCDDLADGINCSVPFNFCGFQYPYEGNGYAGLFNLILGQNFQTSNPGSNQREWIGVRLPNTLLQNAIYCVGYFVSLADTSFITTIPPQVYFSADSINIAVGQYPSFPDYQNNHLAVLSNNMVYDTINWTKVSGDYIATGDERYMYIGNFFDYQNTPWDTIRNNSDLNDFIVAYFYIDSISLVKCGMVGVEENNTFEKIIIYPNPAQDFVSIKLPDNHTQAQLSIYNLTGQLISQKQIKQPNQTIPIPELDNGMYIFVFQNQDKVIGRQRVVVAR